MRTKLHKLCNFFLAFIGITITSSCVMYGCPHSDFEAKGVVTDEEDKGIQGIRVVISADHPNSNYVGKPITDTLWTNHSGEYSCGNEWFADSNRIKIEFEDVDGPENGGEYQKVEIEVPVFKVKEGDGDWYQGAYEAGANVTMNKK
jgi:putative lipoprotein (rSAM/lipoprotein system)